MRRYDTTISARLDPPHAAAFRGVKIALGFTNNSEVIRWMLDQPEVRQLALQATSDVLAELLQEPEPPEPSLNGSSLHDQPGRPIAPLPPPSS